MMLTEIGRMRVEERLREGAEARRAGRVARKSKQSRVRRFVGLGLVRAGHAVLSGARIRVAG